MRLFCKLHDLHVNITSGKTVHVSDSALLHCNFAKPCSAKSNNWLNYRCAYDSFMKRNRHGQTCATCYQMSLHAEITSTYVMNSRCVFAT